MKTSNIIKPIRDHLKHLALALAVCAGLGIGSAQALTYANWTFNDGTGADSSGNGHDLGGQSGPVIASPAGWGPSANCTSHGPGARDGYEAYTSVSGLPTDDFTLGGYFKANHPSYASGTQSSVLATSADGGSSLWIGTRKVDDTSDEWVVFVGGPGGTLLANFPVTPDIAQHIEVTREAGDYSVFLDNTLVAGPTAAGGFTWDNLHVGVNSGGGTGYSGLFGDITVTNPVAHSPEAKIKTFGLPGMPATINQTDKTIYWPVTYVSNPASLAAEFTISDGATAYDGDPGSGGNVITTGTVRNFTGPVDYWVKSSLDEVNKYTVTVYHTPISSAKDITSFSYLGIAGTIDGTNITQNVPFGTDLATLAPDYTVSQYFGGSATGSPVSGNAPSPSFFDENPATYTVTAQDGSTQEYSVLITELPEMPTLVNVNYYGGDKPGNADMDGIYSFDPTASGGASRAAPSAYSGNTWNDFNSSGASGSNLLDSKGNSTAIGFTTTMQNGPWNDWNGLNHNRMLVSAVLADFSTYKPIFTLSGLDTGHAYDLYIASRLNDDERPTDFLIGGTTKHLENAHATDWAEGDSYVYFSNVIPQPDGTLVVNAKGTGDWAGICVNGFQLQDKGVRVGLNTEAVMYSMTFPDLGPATISGTDVSIVVPYGTTVTGLQPTYVASVGASGDPAPGTSTDFTSPVTYTITAEASTPEAPITTDYTVTVTVAPPPPGGTSVGPVCWYDTSDGVTTNEDGQIQSWNDLSGYAHHGTPQNGNPALVADQLNGKPAAQLRGQWLNLAGTFFAKEQYVVVRSPHTDAWGGYGAFLGRASGRGSSYLLTPENTTMWNDQSADAVSKNGTPVPKNQNNNYIFDLAPINEYMLLKIVVNNNNTTAAAYQIGRADGMSCDMDIVEIIGYAGTLSQADENLVGAYVAGKYGLTIHIPSTEPIAFGPTGTGTLTFDAAPSSSEWSTLEVGGGSGTVTDDGSMDIAMGSITASSINTALVAQADNTAGNLAIYRSDLGLLETYVAGGNAMTLLMATLKNTSGSTVDSMTVNYTMGLLSVTPGEQVAGHRVYWSKDGMTWTAVADFAPTAPGTTIPVSFGLTSLAWGPGELLYVVWADDNTPGGVGADGDYTIDGVSFGPSTGGGYAAWALAQVPPVTGGVDGDSNNDGVQNGIAYFMGATGFITNPVLDASNKVTWPKSLTYNGTWQVQISSDLSAWENVASTNDGSSISYTLEPGLGKKFVRLLVTPTP